MPDIFPVHHSTLSADALSMKVLRDYNVGIPTECTLLTRGLNDTYVVVTDDGKFVLRIYRKAWRSESEILFELEALLHLAGKGVSVSAPIRRKDGRITGIVAAPEGPRYIVLFSYAPGAEPTYERESEAESYLYGKVAAQIHAATDTFRGSFHRFSLDLDHLLTLPLRACEPLLAHRPTDRTYLAGLAEKLRSLLQELPSSGLERGFCHGDLYGWNANLDDHNTLTVYDFDCCGMGWRAYDVAVFRWGARIRGKDQERWPSFIRGYTEQRPLNEVDLQAVPYFVAIRHFWLLGLHIGYSRDGGSGWLNDGYFDRALKFFREWETEFVH